MFSQNRERWKAALCLKEKGKRHPAREKAPWLKKKELLFTLDSWCWCKEGMKSVTVMMSENQSCRSQVHVTAFQGTEGYVPKSGFKKATQSP
jgi:hypothetical protein